MWEEWVHNYYTLRVFYNYPFFLRLQILFPPKSKRRVVGKYEREDNYYFTFPLKTNVKFFFFLYNKVMVVNYCKWSLFISFLLFFLANKGERLISYD